MVALYGRACAGARRASIGKAGSRNSSTPSSSSCSPLVRSRTLLRVEAIAGGSRLRADRAALEATLRKEAVMPAGHADARATPIVAVPVAAEPSAAATTSNGAPATAAAAAAPSAAPTFSPASLAALHARARGTAATPPPAEAEIVDAAAAPDAAVVAAALASQLQGPSRRRCALAVNVDVEVYAAARRQLAPLLDATEADGSKTYALKYQARARTLLIKRVGPGGAKSAKLPGTLAVICCGSADAAADSAAAASTADLSAAEAARAVAEHLGCYVLAASAAPGASVDVAAARRALGPALEAADAVVVVAGDADPALPAVVAALTDAPVVALPTSAAGAAAAAASPGVVAVGLSQSAAAAASAARVLRVAATRVGRMLAAQQQQQQQHRA